MKILSRDLGVDLGTANILVYADGKGVVLREPSVVAVDKNTGKILQVGAAARNMLGRTPGNVVAMRPLLGGVISDYEMTPEDAGAVFPEGVPPWTVQAPCHCQCAQQHHGGGGAGGDWRRHGGRRTPGLPDPKNPWPPRWEPTWTLPVPAAIWWWTLAAAPRTWRCCL